MTAEIHYLNHKELTQDQKEYWEQQLEIAERQREYCLRMLGKLGLERGVE